MKLSRVAYGMLGLAFAVATAQREVPMPADEQPTATDAVIMGDQQPHTLTCRDHVRVYIEGSRNEVQLYGTCGVVRIRGNTNFLWLDGEGSIAVQGSNNVIFLRRSTTRVSSLGNANRFELRR